MKIIKLAGAQIVETADEAWKQEMVMKVKEPVQSSNTFHEGLILFTYLHLAPEPELTQALLDKKVVAIAYETVQLPNRSLPLLTPMSEVAGRMATQIGAQYLEKQEGGKGILLRWCIGCTTWKSNDYRWGYGRYECCESCNWHGC